MIYALVQATTILRTADLTEPPTGLPASKGLAWLELIDTPRPAYDPLTHGLRTAPPLVTASQYTKQWEVFPLPAEEVAENLAAARASAVREVDEACAAIYAKVGRFAEEYKLRETQALAYQEAGYTGTVPRQVAAFAVPAGVSSTVATNTILAQASHLRGALENLGELRMRKYEFATTQDLPTLKAQILGSIAVIATSLA